MLQKFHQAGRLQKVSVDNVAMTPRRGINWPLRDILNAMKVQNDTTPADLSDLDPETRAQVISEMGKFNVHAANMEGTTASGQKSEAANLLKMAELLEADANAKRQQAYKIDPSLLKKNKPEEPTIITKTQAHAATKAKMEKTKELPKSNEDVISVMYDTSLNDETVILPKARTRTKT
jgi:hypothetical protein